MTKQQIKQLLSNGSFPERSHLKELIETHISWVILCDEFVYKIKRPVHYPFLNFSTLELREYYCKREIELNRRFSENIYLGVLPIFLLNGNYAIGGRNCRVVDYAIKMRKLDPHKQMDILLSEKTVNSTDIKNLAVCIVSFHKKTKLIYDKNVLDLKNEFSELETQKEFLTENLGKGIDKLIDTCIETSNNFLNKNHELLQLRLKSGFFRDCHGDLHTGNIFFLPAPQPFDCIEFNDNYRQIDVLNEVAFLCMDLDASNREDLSALFVSHYNFLFPVMRNISEQQLFIYYKSYRANVRAKVNSLRASSSSEKSSKRKALVEAKKYLKLIKSYHNELVSF
ncbi:hypothetical protein DET49_1207 [Salegentibacter sp. 24]|uniref:hypothetical protein n=1 Tax=Salegentibacter sp. 24 TaxID=2183986 RepID=UPI0010604046|nr:hypothetical protein [Salegentibacter sp. 24]TDN83808.1 hypothetical protein DET49_1207 [Salegentibacter sp. 24]